MVRTQQKVAGFNKSRTVAISGVPIFRGVCGVLFFFQFWCVCVCVCFFTTSSVSHWFMVLEPPPKNVETWACSSSHFFGESSFPQVSGGKHWKKPTFCSCAMIMEVKKCLGTIFGHFLGRLIFRAQKNIHFTCINSWVDEFYGVRLAPDDFSGLGSPKNPYCTLKGRSWGCPMEATLTRNSTFW